MAKTEGALQKTEILPHEDHTFELDRAVAHATRLLAKHFGAVSNLQSSLMEDAESPESYVEVSFEVRGEVKDVRVAYDAFMDEWVKAYPFPIREQIRFGFEVI